MKTKDKNREKHDDAYKLRLAKGDLVEIATEEKTETGIVLKAPRTSTDTVVVLLLSSTQPLLAERAPGDNYFIGDAKIVLPMYPSYKRFRRLVPAEDMYRCLKNLKSELGMLI